MLAPSFWLLFLFRALLGIGMGAEWPAGAALALEQWPQRSRGLMESVLQSSWGLGAREERLEHMARLLEPMREFLHEIDDEAEIADEAQATTIDDGAGLGSP